MSTHTVVTTEPLDLTNSRASFRDALLGLGLSRPDAVLAAELFTTVVPKTLAALVPEELKAAKDEVRLLTRDANGMRVAFAELLDLARAALNETQTFGPAMEALNDRVAELDEEV